jgi:hypothetical protein
MQDTFAKLEQFSDKDLAALFMPLPEPAPNLQLQALYA